MATKGPRADAWNGYYYYFGEGERCVVTFHVPACEPENQRPSCGRRLIGFSQREHISPQGMPMGPAFDRLKAIEVRTMTLLAQERVSHWLVGRQVYRGMRELLFQIDPPRVDAFDGVCAQVAREFGGTELMPYEGWQFFNDKIRPSEDAKAHISNRDLLEALKRHGADFSRPHTLDHTFVGSSPALARVREALLSAGFRERESSESHVVLSGSALLEQDAIDLTTTNLRAIAKRNGVSYDGWGTMLDRHA